MKYEFDTYDPVLTFDPGSAETPEHFRHFVDSAGKLITGSGVHEAEFWELWRVDRHVYMESRSLEMIAMDIDVSIQTLLDWTRRRLEEQQEPPWARPHDEQLWETLVAIQTGHSASTSGRGVMR